MRAFFLPNQKERSMKSFWIGMLSVAAMFAGNAMAASGADGFLAKPFDLEQLDNALARHLPVVR